jgi:K+-sensing histidine kinase KdpD
MMQAMTKNEVSRSRPEPVQATGFDALPVDELIEEALVGLRAGLAGRRISVFIPADIPLVRVDPAQARRLVRQALDEVIDASSATSEITVSANVWHGAVELRVRERGTDVRPIRLATDGGE